MNPLFPVEFGYFYDAHYPHKVDAAAAVKVATIPSWQVALLFRPVMRWIQTIELEWS